MSDKIIAEVENTQCGTIQVVQHDNENFSVGVLNDKEELIIKHPNADAAGAIRALAFYFQGDINKKSKQN